MRLSRWALTLSVVVAVAVLIAVVPADAMAAGNDVGKNLGQLARHYASELYAGLIAIISLVFLLNRRYGELAMFLLAAVVVGWMVFSPDDVARAARGIGRQVLR